jgi:hypothetical protein
MQVFVRYQSGAAVTTGAASLFNLEEPNYTTGFNSTRSSYTEFVHGAASGQYTFGLGAVRSAGTATCLYGGGAAQPSMLSIDDIGT